MADPLFPSTGVSALQNGVKSSATDAAPAKVIEAATEFEAVFLSQMLTIMTQDLGGAGDVAGGGGDVYRDMFTQEVAKMISRSGGIGVADTVLQEMLKAQEMK